MAERPVQECVLVSGDGTPLRSWRNRPEKPGAPTILLCPGLGAIPEAWPQLLRPDSPFHAISWYHRGTLGSPRPADPTKISLDDHVRDALAVADRMAVGRCVVVGWSVGVAVATELARRHPERVSALLLIGGTPGGTFDAMFGSLGLPASVRRAVATTGVRGLRLLAPLLDPLTHRLPVNRWSALLLQHSGLMRPGGDLDSVTEAMRGFLQHDWRWFCSLALSLGGTPAVALDGLSCPVTVIAGRYDVIADMRAMLDAVGALPQARLRILDTSHFIPLEAPDELEAELDLLVRRADAAQPRTASLTPATSQNG